MQRLHYIGRQCCQLGCTVWQQKRSGLALAKGSFDIALHEHHASFSHTVEKELSQNKKRHLGQPPARG